MKSKHDDVRREKIGMVVVGNFKLSGDRRQETAMTALLGGQRKAINIEGAFNSVEGENWFRKQREKVVWI